VYVCASDVVVPLSVIIGLLVINALVLLFIFRLKKRSVAPRMHVVYIRFAILFRFSASNTTRRRRQALVASTYYDLSAAIAARTQS
jgi:hypothetical protein